MMVANTIFGALSGARKVSWGIVMQELVGKLVSELEKGKPSPISPYLFYFYHRFECLREEEVEILETTKYMLEFGVGLEVETQLDTVDLDSDWKSLSSAEQQRLKAVFPGAKKKTTYKTIDGKSPFRNADWKAITMTSFDFKDNPFR